MGLGISVGLFADLDGDPETEKWAKANLAQVNGALAAEGLPLHPERRTLGPHKSRGYVSSFPYSFIHYLRRAIAYQINGVEFTAAMDDPSEDPILDEELFMMSSHVICHSDSEGFYLPVDFSEPLFHEDAFIGSCFGVIRELTAVAPILGIQIENGVLSDVEAAKLASVEDDLFFKEKVSWFTMWEMSNYAISEKAVLIFC